jgi:LCP family protein required for cell wall assembly
MDRREVGRIRGVKSRPAAVDRLPGSAGTALPGAPAQNAHRRSRATPSPPGPIRPPQEASPVFHRRVPAALALMLATTLTAGQGVAAQSPSPGAGGSPTPTAPCPILSTTSAPLHDPAATVSLGFAASDPTGTASGVHPGTDWTIAGGTTAGAAVFPIGDGQVIAAQPAAPGGKGGIVVVRHFGAIDVPGSPDGAPFTAPASTEDGLLSVYEGVDPGPDLAVGACVTPDAQLGTVTGACADGASEPCSVLPAANHVELRLASTIDPAAPPSDWWAIGTPEDSVDGWFIDAQTMVDDGLRDVAAFIDAHGGTGPNGSPAPGASLGPDVSPAPSPSSDPLAGVERLLGKDGRLTVLQLGSDHFNSSCKRRGDLGGERTDTIMFATINPATGRVAMASYPRDSIQTPIGPGSTYGPKITGLFQDFQLGGSKRAKALKKMVAAMEYFSGVEIDYYVLTYFCGVRRLVDAVGGINVKLDAPLIDPSMHLTK